MIVSRITNVVLVVGSLAGWLWSLEEEGRINETHDEQREEQEEDQGDPKLQKKKQTHMTASNVPGTTAAKSQVPLYVQQGCMYDYYTTITSISRSLHHLCYACIPRILNNNNNSAFLLRLLRLIVCYAIGDAYIQGQMAHLNCVVMHPASKTDRWLACIPSGQTRATLNIQHCRVSSWHLDNTKTLLRGQ